MPSQRRAKQVRRLERIAETGDPERHKIRSKRLEVDPGSLGWRNTYVKMYRVARGLQ